MKLSPEDLKKKFGVIIVAMSIDGLGHISSALVRKKGLKKKLYIWYNYVEQRYIQE